MPKIPTRYQVKFRRSDRNGGTTDETPVELLDGQTIANKLVSLIDKNNVASFKKELNKLYNYPRIDQEFSEGGNIQTDFLESEYAIHPARPRVEALFFDHPAELAKVVDALVKANNPELNAAFMASLQQTELTDDMLFSWDMKIHKNLSAALAELNNYGDLLKQKTISKGQVVIDLHKNLQDDLGKFVKQQSQPVSMAAIAATAPSSSLDVKHSPVNNNLQVLQFKLNFANKLHEQDSVLSMHRGWKRILANFSTILLGFIPLAVNRIVNGHWLFYNKTTSEEKTDNAQKALGFNKEMHFEVAAKQGPGR
jgi:hypothetical protein